MVRGVQSGMCVGCSASAQLRVCKFLACGLQAWCALLWAATATHSQPCLTLPYPTPFFHPHPALVRDLRELPSKAALQLRSDAANTAAVASNQSAAVHKFVKRIAKAYGI